MWNPITWVLGSPFTGEELRYSIAKSLPYIRAENLTKISKQKYLSNYTTRLILTDNFLAMHSYYIHSTQESQDTMLVKGVHNAH